MQVSLYSNGHEKIININFKKENRDPENLPKQGEDSKRL